MTLGKRLLSLREQKKMSQQEIADLIGISRASYSQYETDRREPGFALVIKLADTYRVTLDYLIRGTEPEYDYHIDKREFCNLIEDYIGTSIFNQLQSLSPLGRMWVIDELDEFIQLELRRESSDQRHGRNR